MESKGQKESDNKLSYELDRNFIEAMAKRMQAAREKGIREIKAQKISNFEKEFEELLDKHGMYCHGPYEIGLVDDDEDYYL